MQGDLSVKWYGLNALEFRHSNGSFLIDPYVSRDRTRLHIVEEAEKFLPVAGDFILMSHAHWDHLADIPFLMKKNPSIPFYGSPTACFILQSCGVDPARLHPLSYGEELDLPGNVHVKVYESRHMGIMPEDSFYTSPPPPSALENAGGWKCGEVYNFYFELEGIRILNGGSANLHPPAIKGVTADYFFAGISRWKEGFPELIKENLSFHTLIPTHHDEFKKSLSQFELRDDLGRLKEVMPELTVWELPILQWVKLPEL